MVGAGRVGCRKIAGVLRCSPSEVRVIDEAPAGELLRAWINEGRVFFEQRKFNASDVAGCTLVFAATANRSVNAGVIAACRTRRVLCNSADDPDSGTFLVPARVDAGMISLALSTGGGSPALSARLRRELETWLGGRYKGLAELMGRLRPLVLALGRDSEQNGKLFRSIVDSPLADALSRRDRAASEALLGELLPLDLHAHITELLHDLA